MATTQLVEVQGIDGRITLERGRVCNVSAECTTPGPDTEYVDIEAYWTGEVDTWGKYTFKQTNGDEPVYLFPRELRYAEPV